MRRHVLADIYRRVGTRSRRHQRRRSTGGSGSTRRADRSPRRARRDVLRPRQIRELADLVGREEQRAARLLRIDVDGVDQRITRARGADDIAVGVDDDEMDTRWRAERLAYTGCACGWRAQQTSPAGLRLRPWSGHSALRRRWPESGSALFSYDDETIRVGQAGGSSDAVRLRECPNWADRTACPADGKR